ncbi:30275_t:CDS:2, partial [Racocetra persica]
ERVELVVIVDQKVMIKGVELVSQEAKIDCQKVMREDDQEAKIDGQEVMREDNDQVMIAEVEINDQSNISSSQAQDQLVRTSLQEVSSSLNIRPKYLDLDDLPNDLLAALRHQVSWIIERIPSQDQLRLDQTFYLQKNLTTNTIIPIIIKALDLHTFPVSENIIYDRVYIRHKHQREEYLIKQQSKEYQDKRAR